MKKLKQSLSKYKLFSSFQFTQKKMGDNTHFGDSLFIERNKILYPTAEVMINLHDVLIERFAGFSDRDLVIEKGMRTEPSWWALEKLKEIYSELPYENQFCVKLLT